MFDRYRAGHARLILRNAIIMAATGRPIRNALTFLIEWGS